MAQRTRAMGRRICSFFIMVGLIKARVIEVGAGTFKEMRNELSNGNCGSRDSKECGGSWADAGNFLGRPLILGRE